MGSSETGGYDTQPRRRCCYRSPQASRGPVLPPPKTRAAKKSYTTFIIGHAPVSLILARMLSFALKYKDLPVMMVLYSGTTCPFSQRCRFVLFEKGMDFEVRDVDLFNKPEDISTMNPYGQVPILVERELILYESNIINEYI